ncbi:hypothetical protein [Nocardia neocaledoniensis]|uniref:hypothetical protein n=1 Tax=Nocardia neocaledoniensis TaxID=236511 RepID=UPI002456E694|nr:hypothetical protein [Nocardia neocaledoniensis]
MLPTGCSGHTPAAGGAPAVEPGGGGGAAADGKVSGAPRADYAAAAAAVLTTDGHAGRVYELGGDEALTGADIAAVLAEVTGQPVRYENLTEADYAAVLGQAGLPEPVAAALADADSGIAEGLLEVRTGDLAKLIGRPVTSPAEAFRAILG